MFPYPNLYLKAVHCMNSVLTLNDLKIGQTARVQELAITGGMRRRLQDIGLVEGTRVECIQKSPSGDPKAYLIKGAVIALRSEQSSSVLIVI